MAQKNMLNFQACIELSIYTDFSVSCDYTTATMADVCVDIPSILLKNTETCSSYKSCRQRSGFKVANHMDSMIGFTDFLNQSNHS